MTATIAPGETATVRVRVGREEGVMRSARWLWVGLAGCGGSEVTVQFAAAVDGAPFACGERYEGIGSTGVSIEPRDLRMYVHDVDLLDAEGASLGFVMSEAALQHQGLALLDFEDGSAACETGSTGLNTEIIGTVAGGVGDAAAIVFTIGVPPDRNHLDNATAPAPLNEPGMFWSWKGGYRYVKLDVKTPEYEEFYLHLGATGCEGSPGSGFSCTSGHQSTVTLDGWSPDAAVEIDVAAVYDDLALDAARPETDGLPGCMSNEGDPECDPMMAAFGIRFMDDEASLDQRVFAVRGP
jgi:uncharacterized repeat protein (TIGR04052 family)